MRGRPNTWLSWMITGIMGALGAVAFSYWFEPGVAPAAPQAQTRSVGFTTDRHLNEHYEKHGREFGAISKQQYLAEAQSLRDAQAGGSILESMRKDGVTTRFDRQSGAFIAFNPDRTIRTFFKPNDGERYFHRQAERE